MGHENENKVSAPKSRKADWVISILAGMIVLLIILLISCRNKETGEGSIEVTENSSTESNSQENSEESLQETKQESRSEAEESVESSVTEEQTADSDLEPVQEESTHEHVWQDITEVIHHEAEYETIHHAEVGHYEAVVVQQAWDEEVTEEVTSRHDICKGCGLDMTEAGFSQSDISNHMMQHALADEKDGHYTETRTSIITSTVHHDAVTEQRWVVDEAAYDEQVLVKEAWDETIISGQRCTVCGSTK